MNMEDIIEYYDYPNHNEIYKFVKQILMEIKINKEINTVQYRTILGYARRKNSICKIYLMKWFIKNYPEKWEIIEKYKNTKNILRCKSK